jgi:hypothetical protein
VIVEDCVLWAPDGRPCPHPAEPGAPLALCATHLRAAHDWVERGVGVADLLPGPCLACGSRVGLRYPSGWICASCEWRVGDIPDAELAETTVEVVYYLRFDDRIKIGTTANPRRRIAALPHDEVLAFELGGRSLEARRHAQFSGHRIPGTEWFEANEPLLALVAELRDGVDDPWSRYALWRSRAIALRA